MDYPEMDHFLNESLSDVVFVVDGQRLPALKSILSLKSRVFRSMFSVNFYENKEPEESKLFEVVVKDTTVDAFKTLIRFIYTEKLIYKDIKDWLYIWDVYQLSDKYEIIRLWQKVSTHLESNLNFSNVLSIARVVFNHNIEGLTPKVIDFIDKNLKELLNKHLNGLKELNDSTDDKLLDVITKQALDHGIFGDASVWKGRPPNLENSFYIPTKGMTFAAIKTFIGLKYFDKLSLKDGKDFQLIREVCDMCNRRPIGLRLKSCLTWISKHLEEGINAQNLESISGIAFDYNMVGLIEKVNQMNIQLFQPLD